MDSSIQQINQAAFDQFSPAINATAPAPVPRIEQIRSALEDIIHSNNFGVLTRYPNDIEICLRRIAAYDEGSFAICIGDCHIHEAILGIHKEQNDLVNCLTNLSNTDQFFQLTLKMQNQFSLKKFTAVEFRKLDKTHIPYTAEKAGPLDFRLLLNNKPIVSVQISYRSVSEGGGNYKKVFTCRFSPCQDVRLRDIDRRAASFWAHREIACFLGSLFYTADNDIWSDAWNG